MCLVAAAPHLFDEPFVASPELALVDEDLAAQLREDIRSGEEFRPRASVRPEFRLLHPVADAAEVGADPAVAAEPELAADAVHDAEDVLPEVDPIVVALETLPASPEVADAPESLNDVVLTDDLLVENVAVDDEVLEVETDAVALDVRSDVDEVPELPDDALPADDLLVEDVAVDDEVLEVEADAVALDIPWDVDQASEPPDYVVLTDVVVEDFASEDEVAEVVELPEGIVPHDEAVEVEVVDVEPGAVEVLPAPSEVDEAPELPDYVVTTEETAAEVGATALLGGLVQLPVSEAPSLPDYVILPEDSPAADTAPVGAEQTTSDYPELPDLGQASEALEETDAALRRIREQLTTKEARPRKRRLRRRFTIASGLGAIAAVAAFGVNAQLGVNVLGF